MSGTIEARYADRIRRGLIEPDSAQKAVVARLDRLRGELGQARLARKASPLGWLFGGTKKVERPRGLYIWGEVGRGKTMLMDLFFDTVEVRRKRRAHFLAFMADVHARIFAWRQKKKAGQVKGEDPIAPVAADLADEAWLLCFDEFAVTDIADAMILGRLFQALFAHGVVVIATSNVAPENLYRDGLNRALFLPFIGMIRDRMEVVRLDAGQSASSLNGAARLAMQTDGNLVVYDSAGRARWASSTFTPGSYMVVQPDGNLVVYRPSGAPAWAS